MAPSLPSAEDLASEALAVCQAVVEAPQGRIVHAAARLQWLSKLYEKANRFFQDGRYDQALPSSMEALAAAAIHLDGAEHKAPRDRGITAAKHSAELFQHGGDHHCEGQALVTLARLQVVRNRPDAAIKTANDAAQVFRKAGSRRGEATCLSAVVDAHVRKASLEASGKTVRKSHQTKMTPSEIQEDLRKRSSVHLQDALTQVPEALELFTLVKEKRSKADLLYTVADIRLSLGQHEDAKEYSMTARDLYHDLEDPKGEQMALLLELDVHIADRNGPEALDVGKEIVKLFRKAKDQRGEAEGMFTMMQVYGMMRQQEDMMSTAAAIRALCKETRDIKMEGLVIDAIMKSQIEQESWNDALKTAQEAMEFYRKASDKQGEAMAFHSSACLQLDRFFEEVNNNLDHFKKMGCMKHYWKEVDKAKYDELVGMLSKAVEIFKQVGDNNGQRMAEDTLQSTEKRILMLNEPDETKQIRKNGRIVETIRTWNPKGEVTTAVTN